MVGSLKPSHVNIASQKLHRVGSVEANSQAATRREPLRIRLIMR